MHGRTVRFVVIFISTAFSQFVASQTLTSPNLGRNLAAQCANCHGTDGRSVGGFPSLAGQPASVIVQKMKAYRDGKSSATVMQQLAKGYSDEQVALMADYFSRQTK